MSITPLLVALPLVGGYTFSVVLLISLYHSARESGHRLYFRAVFYAAFLVITASLLHIILYIHTGWYHTLYLQLFEDILNLDRGGIWTEATIPAVLLLSLLISAPLAGLLNLTWIKWLPGEISKQLLLVWQTYLLKNAIRNNDFELLIMRSFETDIPVMFTLTTGKVYVGRIVRPPNPIEARKAIRILPLLSGYRDKETQEFELATVYADLLQDLEKEDSERPEHLKHLTPQDFEVVFPSDSVCSSHLFDIETYVAHFLQTENDVTTTTPDITEEADVQ